ncbi:unnamed protein product, partial [Bubo scandiacus]
RMVVCRAAPHWTLQSSVGFWVKETSRLTFTAVPPHNTTITRQLQLSTGHSLVLMLWIWIRSLSSLFMTICPNLKQ